MAASNSFYDAILGAGASMEKKASENDLARALEETDLNEDELNKLASEIEDALNNIDDVDDIDDVETDENVEDEIEDTDETEEEAGEEVGETEEEEADEEADEGVGETEEEEADEEAGEEADEEVDETDIEQLAAAYEEAYEKYASEGYGVRDYVYNQVADEEFACTVGDMAEKLAFVAELPVFMVADDLINTIASKISEDENC